ncbi:MAG: prepilin peptidase [Nitrososphaerota archaeon]
MYAVLGFVLAIAVLTYASYRDLRERMVSDAVWLAGVPVAVALDVIGLLFGEIQPAKLLVSISVSACIGAALYHLGLVGGADGIAFAFLGLAVPAYPKGLPLLGDPLALPPLATFFNASLLSLVFPLTIFTMNLADIVRGRNPFRGVEVRGVGDLILILFTTRRINLEKVLGGLLYFPAERIEVEGRRIIRKPIFFIRAEADISGEVAKIAEHREVYKDGVLASPTIPMIVFLAIGLALSTLGNLVFLAFKP